MQAIERVKLVGDDTGIRVRRYRHKGYHMHWHNFYEFEITLDGAGTHIMNNTVYPNERGNIFFMRTTDFHEIVPESSTEIYRIQIPASCLPEDVHRLLSVTSGNLYAHAPEETLTHIISLCELLSSATSDCCYDKEYTEQLLSVTVRTFIKLIDPNIVSAASNSRLVDVCTYIEEHFKEDITIQSIALHFGFNKNYLCTFFKSHTGMTVNEFIKELRLQFAARLSGMSQYSSLQISEMSGYGSHSNFLRDFKKRFGISPLQMRKRP